MCASSIDVDASAPLRNAVDVAVPVPASRPITTGYVVADAVPLAEPIHTTLSVSVDVAPSGTTVANSPTLILTMSFTPTVVEIS